MSVHNFNLFADYHQFYLQDENSDSSLEDSWTPEATDRLLAVAPGVIGVGTMRNMTVPVSVEVRDTAPVQSVECDHEVECSIKVESGKLVVAGCTDYLPDAARIQIKPGTYRARISYSNLDSLSNDGLEGDDKYSVVLWPSTPTDVVIRKQRNAEVSR
jgi:hypothetical protein